MKLYATVRSERAEKGQGGNEYLNIVIRNSAMDVLKIDVVPSVRHKGPDFFDININGRLELSFAAPESKGEKQKGKQVKVRTERTYTQGDDFHD